MLYIPAKRRQSIAMSVDRWVVRRFRHEQLEPILLWDARLSDDTEGPAVYDRLGRHRIESLRRDGAEDQEIARTMASEVVDVLVSLHARGVKAACGFDRALVEGRLLELKGFRTAIDECETPFEVALAPPRPTCVELGAERLWHYIHRNGPGLLVDVGHAAVNTIALGRTPRRCSLERSFDRLPAARGSIPPPSIADPTPYVTRSAEFVARAVVSSLLSSGPLDPHVVLALPCELDEDGIPGPCTYPGWEGNPHVVSSIVQAIDAEAAKQTTELRAFCNTESIEVWVLSHAEVVALASEAILGPARPSGTLALSLGFGPSAALLRGDS